MLMMMSLVIYGYHGYLHNNVMYNYTGQSMGHVSIIHYSNSIKSYGKMVRSAIQGVTVHPVGAQKTVVVPWVPWLKNPIIAAEACRPI